MATFTARELGRLLVLVLIGAYVLAPVPAQLVGHRPPPWIRGWRMYATVGSDLCQVTYFERKDGADHPIDRRATMDLDDELPRRGAIRRAREVDTQGVRICKRIGATDVRADARCGSPRRWRPTHARERNLCEVAR